MTRGRSGPARGRAALPGIALALLALVGRPAIAAVTHYNIDQRYGSIGFSVSELGLFDAVGSFQKFAGRLAIDPAHPERTVIDVQIAAGSVAMSSSRAVHMLLSPAYFDTRTYPAIAFRSTSVVATGPDRYRVSGLLRIRGVTHPQTLEAVLDNRKGSAGTAPTAYFTVRGQLHRSRFGMKANENFVGDIVNIVIHIHIASPLVARAR